MIDREIFRGAPWTIEGQKRIQEYENRYLAIQPYIEQTERWKAQMRYEFCPQKWPITETEVKTLEKIGREIGRLLIPKPIGFRIDFVENDDNQFWITEVQTDDRGLPEMAILRNAYGNDGRFKGVVPAFLEAIRVKFGSTTNVAVIYPDQEYFYYAGFYDFARLCRAEGRQTNVWVIPQSEIQPGEIFRAGKYPYCLAEAQAMYDFTDQAPLAKSCFTIVGKDLLVTLSQSDSVIMKTSLPPTQAEVPSNEPRETLVIKPINGRWSQGVVFGNKATRTEWEQAIEKVRCNEAIVQKFIPPKTEYFPVREEKNKSVSYPQTAFLMRIEGYFFLNQDGEYSLADIMVTGRDRLPVHGVRDCIMIPAASKNI